MFASDHWLKRLSLHELGHRLRSVPLLVVLVPYMVGIVLYEHYEFPIVVAFVALGILSVVGWLLLPRRVAWGYIVAAMVMLGYVVSDVQRPRAVVPYDEYLDMSVELSGVLAQREGYRVAEGVVTAWRDDDGWHGADDRVQLWVRSSTVNEGDRVELRSRLVRRMSRYEGYNDLLVRRGYVGGVSVTDRNIYNIEPHQAQGLQHRAIARLDRHVGDSLAHATVVAMVAGSRVSMSEEQRDEYSRTGLMHLMAVSGLHLGIVAMVVGWLLLPLCLVHRGHRLRNLVTIAAIWLFALVSGASPSVVRAALMFSLLQLSRFSSSRYNSLNALSLAVLLMLVFRPNYLFDCSFELSVMAVAGIVLWSVPICRSIRLNSGVIRSLLSAVVVGVEATLWTAPIISYNFSNLPIIGAFVTPIAVVASTVVVGAGIISLVLPSPLYLPFSVVAEWAAEVQNYVVSLAAMPRWAAIDYTISEWGVVAIYAIYIAITLMMWAIEPKKVVTLYYDDEYRSGDSAE